MGSYLETSLNKANFIFFIFFSFLLTCTPQRASCWLLPYFSFLRNPVLWPYLVKDINLRRVRKQTLQLNEIVRLHLFKATGTW